MFMTSHQLVVISSACEYNRDERGKSASKCNQWGKCLLLGRHPNLANEKRAWVVTFWLVYKDENLNRHICCITRNAIAVPCDDPTINFNLFPRVPTLKIIQNGEWSDNIEISWRINFRMSFYGVKYQIMRRASMRSMAESFRSGVWQTPVNMQLPYYRKNHTLW